MCEVSKGKMAKNQKRKKYNGQQQKKMDYDEPYLALMKKRSPSNGQNGQLVHR
jgi:hypothetical protein